ncbi:hypothetical protein CGCTS75_v006981 [Colletotrichum tropicale]|nr:hypothetical protein CGCTS75_v006981 [Colletotrichum tropicale]
MQFSCSAVVVVGLLSGQTLASCARGSFSGKPNDYDIIEYCALKPDNFYDCSNGASVTHNADRFTLQAGSADAMVMVACGGYGSVYHCSAGESAVISQPLCAGGMTNVRALKQR